MFRFTNIFLFRREPDALWPRWKKNAYCAWRPLLLSCAGFCMGLVLLVLAAGVLPTRVSVGLLSYISHWETLVLNTVPVVLLALLFYGVFGRAWAAFLLSGAACFALSLGNYYKIFFRSDPVYMEDIFVLREAGNMAGAGHYNLFIDKKILLAAFCLLLGTVLLLLLAPGKTGRRRLAFTAAAAAAGACLMPVYLDNDIYDGLDNYEFLTRWNPTEEYIAHGCLYPFLHSASGILRAPPRGYSASESKEMLAAYADADIPADRQVNIIAIMREAYADFSLYGVEGLDKDCYTLYHQLEEESYTGDLVTNIFGGGTVDTERCFLTGGYEMKNFRSNVNSYVWYLREQGYRAEGSHPYYQWFYNRQNVNSYLGFERYRFLEGDYDRFTDALLPEDSILYPEVYADFQAAKNEGIPYFSFVVNVQSHGPYGTWWYGGEKEYLTGNYSEECKYAMNNYMSSIMSGDVELMKLVEKLRGDTEPVILVTFGDHLPWMGDKSVFYEEMGINVDPGTEDGFFTHYTTRYLIWANDAARETLGHDVKGEGPMISPCYLMNLVFRQLGWDGPAYAQAMDKMMDVFPVVSTAGRYVVDGAVTDIVPEERRELLREFRFLQYFWQSEWGYG